MDRYLLCFMAIVLISACAPKSEPISYGENDCSYCRMTIVDKIHGAELVTSKGKVYKYDAVECMVMALKEMDETDMAMILVNHLEEPEALIDANTATFLISKELPSPMGGFLTAFASRKAAEDALTEYGGELHSWEELKNKYK
jgi:copper chaperone NosL